MYKILVKSGLSFDTVDELKGLLLKCLSDNICNFDYKVFKWCPHGQPPLVHNR